MSGMNMAGKAKTEIFEEVSIDEISNDQPITIYTNKKQIREIIKELGYAIDDDGFVVFKDTGKRVLSSDEQEFKVTEIGALMPANSPHVFIKNNLSSLSRYLADKE
ncbi:MAG TPA: hypothetical protein VJH23_03255 [archaeon]|nr:hypothetical protein [archaeon]